MREPTANPPNRIVVGASFSEASDHAVCAAVRLARHVLGSELHLTHVVPTNAARCCGEDLDDVAGDLRTKCLELREHVTQLCAPAIGVAPTMLETQYHLRIGEPAAAIYQVAIEVGADLIVVGARADQSQTRPHSVAEELVRSARVAVLVSRPTRRFLGN